MQQTGNHNVGMTIGRSVEIELKWTIPGNKTTDVLVDLVFEQALLTGTRRLKVKTSISPIVVITKWMRGEPAGIEPPMHRPPLSEAAHLNIDSGAQGLFFCHCRRPPWVTAGDLHRHISILPTKSSQATPRPGNSSSAQTMAW